MSTASDTRRAYQGPALLSYGFRPFFLGAAVFAAMAMPLWVAVALFGFDLPAMLSARDWHVHEMLYGYLGAVLAGFLLTAIPNWTGRLPLFGVPLALFFALWCGGRLAMVLTEGLGVVARPLDVSFLLLLAGFAWREVLAGRNWRNAPICLLVTVFALSNVAFHVEAAWDLGSAYGARLGIAVAGLLIALVGGRITPSFTRNWLSKRRTDRLPAAFGRFDKAALALTAVSLAIWVVAPAQWPAGIALLGSGVVQLLRLLRWRGGATLAEPLVFILHVGYAWLAAALILIGLAALGTGWPDPSSAIHALTAGAVGTMTLAVMTRASLGHSGRALTANRPTVALYALVSLGALGRVLADTAIVDPLLMIAVGGILWSLAFVVFAAAYGPILLCRGHGAATRG